MADVTAQATAEIQDDTNTTRLSGTLILTVPDSDPGVAGALYSDSGVLTVSAG